MARVDQRVGHAPPAGRRCAGRGGAPGRRRLCPRPAGIVADQQRAEPAARRAALRPPADHELLPADELELPPRGVAAARQVPRRGVLDDQPLPVVGQRLVAQVDAAAALAGNDPHRPPCVRVETLDEPRPAFGERPRAQVLVAVPNQVERDEDGAGGRGRRGGPAAPVHAALDALERQRTARRVDGHDLAVEHDGAGEPRRERGQPARDLGKLRGLLVAQAGPDTDVRLPRPRSAAPSGGGRDLDQGADAVVLPLEDEVAAPQQPVVRRLVHRDREHRPQRGRLLAPRRRGRRLHPRRAPPGPAGRHPVRPGSLPHRSTRIPAGRPKPKSRC